MLIVVSAGLVTTCATGDGTTLRAPDPGAPHPTDVPITPTTLGTAEAGIEAAAAETTKFPEPIPSPVELFAPWPDGGVIGPLYSCEGSNAAPPLSWTGIPDDTAELAITVVNGAASSDEEPFVHWVMWGLDPTRTGLTENEMPPEASVALNSLGNTGYDGPCPDPGSTDVFRFTVHALFQQLEFPNGAPAADVIAAIELLAIGESSLVAGATR